MTAPKKISELTAATTLTGSELIPIVQSGVNKTATPDLINLIGINPQTDDYTLALGDAGKLITIDYATGKSLIVPKNSVVAFPVGTQISVTGIGAGQITVEPVDGDVTINSADGALKLRVQFSAATLIKTDTNTWLLMGDIAS
jgi:hypothetical protein